MQILCIGDVVGSRGCNFLRRHLPALRRTKGIDVVIANGENSSDGNGITPASAGHLFDSGVDVITTGNHTYRRREVYDYLDAFSNCAAKTDDNKKPSSQNTGRRKIAVPPDLA